MATKQLTNNINSGFYPTYYNMPMLGFGDFLKSNAGTIGSLVGAGAGLLVGNPMLGAKVGGVVGGVVQAGDEKKQAEIAMQKQIEEQQKQLLLQQYNSGMLNSYASGGELDNITHYATGGSHETNPHGGIPLGNSARVEAGEVRYDSKKHGSYIFSDRF